MTMVRRAVSTAFFSDAILCRFRLRPVRIGGVGSRARFAIGPDESERVIDCTFCRPYPRPGRDCQAQEQEQEQEQEGEGRCAIRPGDDGVDDGVSVVVHDRQGGLGRGVRMFAGLVSDPFIFQFESLHRTIATGRIAFQREARNSLEGANVLGLVVEIERGAWLTGGPLFGVVGETLASGTCPTRLERIGRPEIKNISLEGRRYVTANRHVDLGDLYNREDAFHVAGDHIDAYRARLNANFRFFDDMDGRVDWPLDEGGKHPLVDMVLDDYLVVDASKPFTDVSYFEIEQAMLGARGHQTCGGRTLNDDVLDTYYTLLINAGKGPRISDGVDQATVPASSVFPYLAPPNPLREGGRPGTGARPDVANHRRPARGAGIAARSVVGVGRGTAESQNQSQREIRRVTR